MLFVIIPGTTCSIPIPSPETTAKVLKGMELKDIAIFFTCMLVCMAIVLYILNYIMQIKLKPVLKIDEKLDAIQKQQTAIMTKIKSSEDLSNMIKLSIMEHAQDCPNCKKIKGGPS